MRIVHPHSDIKCLVVVKDPYLGGIGCRLSGLWIALNESRAWYGGSPCGLIKLPVDGYEACSAHCMGNSTHCCVRSGGPGILRGKNRGRCKYSYKNSTH